MSTLFGLSGQIGISNVGVMIITPISEAHFSSRVSLEKPAVRCLVLLLQMPSSLLPTTRFIIDKNSLCPLNYT